MHDAERFESRLVEANRSIEILDGYEDVVEQEFTSFVSGSLPSRRYRRCCCMSSPEEGVELRTVASKQ
jgi:hypothetical protein